MTVNKMLFGIMSDKGTIDPGFLLTLLIKLREYCEFQYGMKSFKS